MDRIQIGRWLARRRKQLKLTQANLGAKLSYTPQAISLIEMGKSSMLISTLYVLAEELRCSPEDILNCAETVSEAYRVYKFDPARYAHNLKYARKKLHLRQVELADMLHVSSRTLRTYEKDKATPSVEYVCELARIAGITLQDLEKK